jgi:hypothetical protein
LLETEQILGSGDQQLGVVAHQSEGAVAIGAEKFPSSVRDVIVIDGERADASLECGSFRSPANRADAGLRQKHFAIFNNGHSEVASQSTRPLFVVGSSRLIVFLHSLSAVGLMFAKIPNTHFCHAFFSVFFIAPARCFASTFKASPVGGLARSCKKMLARSASQFRLIYTRLALKTARFVRGFLTLQSAFVVFQVRSTRRLFCAGPTPTVIGFTHFFENVVAASTKRFRFHTKECSALKALRQGY